MAMRNLVEAQCGEVNPVLSLTHHVTRDKAHKQDTRFISNLNEVYHYKPSYDVHISSDQLAAEFMNEARIAATTAPQAFRMDSLLQEMQVIERVPPLLGPGVADLASDKQTWCKQFFDLGHMNREEQIAPSSSSEWLQDANSKWDEAQAVVNSKCESMNDQQQYNPHEDRELAQTANELLGTVEDPKFSNTEFMEYVRSLSTSEKGTDLSLQATAVDWRDELITSQTEKNESLPKSVTWERQFVNGLANQPLVSNKADQWQKEFEKAKEEDGGMDNVELESEALTSQERDASWHQMQKSWEDAVATSDDDFHSWMADFEQEDMFKNYEFSTDNALRSHPDPLAEGKRCLETGDLPSAVLCFESAVQRNGDNAEAWLLLGRTHAENEQDPAAIRALRKGLELDPSNLQGWMSLATCYTNESYGSYACYALKEWIRNNEEYRHLLEQENSFSQSTMLVTSLASKENLDSLRQLLVRCANLRPPDNVDGDVQCGLGVLLNLTGEFDKAVDCFRAALQVKPNDARLWNKLGATLANSERSAEAIEAYRAALDIAPGFIRCRYNLGIACINLGAHREALEHFLSALSLQASSANSSADVSRDLAVSDNIWSTVRVCLKNLDASHLIDAAYKRDLNKLNAEFGSSSSS